MNPLLRAAKQWVERFQTSKFSRSKLSALAYRGITTVRMQADDLGGTVLVHVYVYVLDMDYTCTVHIKQIEGLQVMAKFLLGFHFGSQPASHH